MTKSDLIQILLATGAPDAAVVGTTRHGTYTFDIAKVEHDTVEQRVVLRLQEIPPRTALPCSACGRPREEWPAIFRNDDQCSDTCRKAAAA